MALENKKVKDVNQIKKQNKLKAQTIKDKQDSNKDDTIERMLIAGTVALVGFGVYKSGIMKRPIGALKEFGASIANGSAKGYDISKTLKDWTENRTGDILRPSRSIFNAKKTASAGYDILQDLKESVARGQIYTANTRRIINDTVADINILNDMISKRTRGFTNSEMASEFEKIENAVRKELVGKQESEILQEIATRKQNFLDLKKLEVRRRNASTSQSTLNKNIRDIRGVMDSISHENVGKNQWLVGDELTKNFVKKMTLTEEQAAYQLKHTNYKTLTLGDIFESYDLEKRQLVFKEGFDEKILREKFGIDFESTDYSNKTLLDNLNNFLSDRRFNIAPEGENIPRTLGNFDKIWKNLIIDEGINIRQTENGPKIINYMMGTDAFKFFGNSLRRDFGLPLLGFNPLESIIKITPLDKVVNNKTINYAFINGVGNYSPFITGKGTRNFDDINTFLQKKFNAPEETFHVLFSDGDLFAIGNKGTKEFLGSGFNAYDIKGADKKFKLPHSVEILREMGGYDLNRDFVKQFVDELGINIKDLDKSINANQFEALYNLKLTPAQKLKYEIGRFLDIGYQEMSPHLDNPYTEFNERVNIDEWFDKIINNIVNSDVLRTNGFNFKNHEEAIKAIREKTYETAFGKNFAEYIVNGEKISRPNVVITKKGYSIKDLFKDAYNQDLNKFQEDAANYFGQFFSGFDKDYNIGKHYTEKTGMFYDIFNVLDSGLSSIGLGLGMENKRSTASLFKGLLLKRALPVFMLTQIPGMIDYFSEPIFTNSEEKENGENDRLSRTLMRDVVKPIDIKFHQVKDRTGFTKIFKYLQEMTPGSEQINELPLIYQLGLGQSEEERKEYIENGYDPVRKNRYWSVSNTPYTGSKIDHWRPNIYRRVEADTKYTSTMYGSRKEYYQNVWYPNLVSPLAPIRHFITDPHHWDKKHYYDRPYAETAPKGENIPLIGPLVSGTVGQVYRKKMHKEYWNKDGTLKPVNPEDEKPSQLLATGVSQSRKTSKDVFNVLNNAFVDAQTFEKIKQKSQIQYRKAEAQRFIDIDFIRRLLDKSAYQAEFNAASYRGPYYTNDPNRKYTVAYNSATPGKLDVVRTGMPQSDVEAFKEKLFTMAKEYNSPLQTSTLPYRSYDRYGTALDAYITSSGEVQIVDVPENLNLYKVNEEIKHYSLNKIYGTNQRVDFNAYNKGYSSETEEQKTDGELSYYIGEFVNDISNVYGLKGFLAQAVFTGERNVGATRVENSSYAYSPNRSFWDQNLGGFGGELSEIARRFIHKKDNDVEYLNPIRNTMPTWLPGSNYFTDFLHGDPYSKIMNGEERLPGEAYERLNGIEPDLTFNTSASMLGLSRSAHVRHFLNQDTNITYAQEQKIKGKVYNKETGLYEQDVTEAEILEDDYKLQNLNKAEEIISKILDHFRVSDVLLDYEAGIYDQTNRIESSVNAIIKDRHSRTGKSLINIRGVSAKEFETLKNGHNIRNQDYYEMNYDLYAFGNTKGRGYIYYYNEEAQDKTAELYKARVKFNKKDLRESIKNLNEARQDIYTGLKNGEINRGDLYSLIDKYRILADVAPYSQEFKDISAQVSHAHLTAAQKREISAIHKRMKEQKEPLRTYDYKFKTSNLKSERVTVKEVLDNNTIIVREYGRDHAIKLAGINVSESQTKLYAPTVKEKERINKATGRKVKVRTGKTMADAAYDEMHKYIRPGRRITIQYDADERNKYNKDSTRSIKAVIQSKGTNVNRLLLEKGLAKEKENDESPAAIHARYSKGDIAFGSMMESITHGIGSIPFIGDKILQVRSPYEQYRKKEVYNKDFKSWNHPIRDFLVPAANEASANFKKHPVSSVVVGAFIGSMFGKNPYGKLIGTLVGGTIPAIGGIIHAVGSDKEHDYRPRRRRQQEEINTYVDTLKYVKNTRLYNKYKDLAKEKDNFDVDAYLESKYAHGAQNKERAQELKNYKRIVKLDFEHRDNYNFKYGRPKYLEEGQNKSEVITAINRELAEITNDRKVEKLPVNAIKAIQYRNEAEKTMYGYDPGDDVRNIMSALPKKERQYYSKLVEAPEEEKDKILRVAPSYLRRALQASWGMDVDEKPELQEYFMTHALPDENWVGWNEESDINDIKVKIVNANGLDPGEFDIWTDNKKKADEVNIPIPKLHVRNDATATRIRLNRILNNAGLDDVQVSVMPGISDDNVSYNIRQDSRDEVSQQIANLNYA